MRKSTSLRPLASRHIELVSRIGSFVERRAASHLLRHDVFAPQSVSHVQRKTLHPLNTNGPNAFACDFVSTLYSLTVLRVLNLSNLRRTFGSSVSMVHVRIDHGHQLAAGWHIRGVAAVPAKQHDKRQRDEGKNGDRDSRATGHSALTKLR
jgi:hypothetical protein